jgi:ABC-2 type transport system ATP-binding protein/lipopolysaccharide transport system ATP-binding protein
MNPVIILDNICVHYRAPETKFGTFKEYAIQLLKRNVRYKQFTALNNVSLQVNEGEILGIIGRNGAGKSTLLKVISRVIYPTEGRVRIRGRVSPLLELAAGFHPELTGLENIFLNGTLLGRTRREIESKLADIIEFAELDSFIDSPLRTYSSGMVARLGFSVSTTWQPEILLLDEILSVGDEAFRNKCKARMAKYRDAGTTILMVAHDSGIVEALCARAAWLDHGEIKAIGPAKEVIGMYRRSQ